jgi:hypothetical protein
MGAGCCISGADRSLAAVVADIGLFCQRQLDYGVPFRLHISVRDADKHDFVAVPVGAALDIG